MQTSSLTAFALSTILALSGAAQALEAQARLQPQPSSAVASGSFASAAEALRSGLRDYNAGDKAGAVQALEYAAAQGQSLASWKLGRMYAEGDGVKRDDLKAFEYFSKVVDQNAEEGPDSQNAALVASSLVALGSYFLEGIEGTYVARNVTRAREMFHYAASHFGSASGQYALARLYLDGTGVERDPRLAARWLNLAAEKGHYQSQALLGRLLLTGQGVPRQRARGLMWLTLAREAADPVKDQWISDLYESAFAAAAEGERRTALAQLEQFLKTRR